MQTLKNPLVALAAGVLLGYVFQKVLDNVPLVNRLPKVRVTGF